MTGREKSGRPETATQWGVPGGGENARSWRHREIVAAFESIEVADAIAQADKFEQISRWWDDCVLDFEHAVNEALTQAWSGVGATGAGSAIAAYLAQARDLAVALEKLPAVVRVAADAIVATRCAIPPLVTDIGTSMASGRTPAVGRNTAAWSVHDAGSAATHGTASAAEETARTEMGQKYVTAFGELVGRIPLLPTPTRRFGAVAESGDQRLLVDGGRLPDDRRARSTVGAAEFADGSERDRGPAESGIGSVKPDSSAINLDGDDVAEADKGAVGATPASADQDRVMTSGAAGGAATGPAGGGAAVMASSGTGISLPGAVGTSGQGSSGALTPPWGNSAAAVESPTTSAGRSSRTRPLAGSLWPTAGTECSGDRASGGSRYQPTGQHDVGRPGSAHSVPGATGSVNGADPAAGHASTRSVERYFHCAGAPQASPAPDEGGVRRLPEYLITLANTRELLGVPRPAIAGGVIGGDELVPDEQRSSATRG